MRPEDVIRHAANPFLALGLPVAAISQTDLKKKYKQLALLFHPDKSQHPSAEAAFKIVVGAYEQLRDITTQPGLVRRFSTPRPRTMPHSTDTARKRPPPPTPFSQSYFVWAATLPKPPFPPRMYVCPNCLFVTLEPGVFESHKSVHVRKRPGAAPRKKPVHSIPGTKTDS